MLRETAAASWSAKMTQTRCRDLGCLVALLLAVSASGCQHLMFWDNLARLPSASEKHPVVEVICLWEQAEGTGLDGLPCRGFAGQLLFFAQGRTPPVRVHGNIHIYVFDDQGTLEEQEHPIHQFDFDSKAFQSFLTDTNIGAAYQMFIPYTRKGSHRATCSLRVRFTPAEGNPVYSKMASVILSGKSERAPDRPIGHQKPTASHNVQLAAHQAEVPEVFPDSAPAIPVSPKLSAAITSNPEEDRQRLKAKLIEVTQPSLSRQPEPSTAANSQTHPLERNKFHPLEEGSLSEAQVQPARSRHPLLED
jgi:hypothetical protein